MPSLIDIVRRFIFGDDEDDEQYIDLDEGDDDLFDRDGDDSDLIISADNESGVDFEDLYARLIYEPEGELVESAPKTLYQAFAYCQDAPAGVLHIYIHPYDEFVSVYRTETL